MFSFDVSRYHEGTVANAKWVEDRTHESYAKTYAIVFPHDEALAGRGARKSHIHDDLVSNGCVHQARHGFERPGWFVDPSEPAFPLDYDYYGAYSGEDNAWRLGPDRAGDDLPAHEKHRYNDLIDGELTFDWPASHNVVAEECRAARQGVALFDQSYFGKFHISGARAAAAVQFLCGADIEAKGVGGVTYTPLCNKFGGVEADLTIAHLSDERFYVASGGNTVTKDFAWIRRIMDAGGFDDVELKDDSDEFALISVQGPHSRRLLQSVGLDQSIENEDLPFSHCLENVTVAGNKGIRVLRLTFVGELGFELHAPKECARQVYAALKAAGAAYESDHGVPVRDAGYRCIDSCSAEKNLRHWHADLSNCDSPMEAGIGFTVLPKLKRIAAGDDSAKFYGCEALQKKREEGLQRKLICLTLDKHVPLHGFETIRLDGKPIGLVRSTAFGHTIGKTIAYGYIKKPAELAKITNKWLKSLPSDSWTVGDKGDVFPATLHIKAPFDPSNEKIKG